MQVLGTENYVTVDGAVHHNSSKSVGCAHELMRWATSQRPNAEGIRKTRFLIVRNTLDQLRSTTLKTIEDWFPPDLYGTFRRTERTIMYTFRLDDDTVVQSEWMLVSLDEPADVRKALSLEATGVWGNEARELHPEVVDGLLMRVNRYPSMKDGGATRAGAIFDTNMPMEDSWWAKRMEDPPKNWSVHLQPPAVLPLEQWVAKYGEDPDEAMVAEDSEGTKFAVDPAAENYVNLSPDYYPNTMQGKTPDFIRVYLRSQFGRSMAGNPVYDRTYNEDRHVTPAGSLTAVRSDNYPLCIGLDFGRTPAAVILQTTPHGFVHVLDEITSENMGIQTFVRTLLKPFLTERYPGLPHFVAPDPAGWQRSQVGETSPVDILRSEGFEIVKPGSNDPMVRVEAVEAMLSQGRLRIDGGCKVLIAGFRGKYQFKPVRSGDAMPLKNHPWSDVHDALQYACLTLDASVLGAKTRQRRPRTIKKVHSLGWT